jgi:predicted permease
MIGTDPHVEQTEAATAQAPAEAPDVAEPAAAAEAKQPESQEMSWGMIAVHVLIITLLSNLGKMFPVFCYRQETHWRNRLAVCVAMFPRGEVGAGVLVISLAYGITGPMIIVAMFSLALNLLATGLFIIMVKYLIKEPSTHPVAPPT